MVRSKCSQGKQIDEVAFVLFFFFFLSLSLIFLSSSLSLSLSLALSLLSFFSINNGVYTGMMKASSGLHLIQKQLQQNYISTCDKGCLTEVGKGSQTQRVTASGTKEHMKYVVFAVYGRNWRRLV